MSTKVFDVFEEYSYLSDKRKFTLWTWFKIYIFSKEDVDLVEELDKLNSLLVKHNMHEYGGFLVCLYHLLLSDRAFAFLSKNIKKKNTNMATAFNFIVNFQRTIDENGSMTWTISDNHISILYYFNDKNLDLPNVSDVLNSYPRCFCLAQRG